MENEINWLLIKILINIAFKVSPNEVNEALEKFGEETFKVEQDITKLVNKYEQSLKYEVKSIEDEVTKIANEYP